MRRVVQDNLFGANHALTGTVLQCQNRVILLAF